ncbi:MAG: glycosyl hydrolase 115 family protein [Anaerolineales bacterium]|nr:glycosyl hydrolase 115 family protein [Anaerolineales bacterium]
MVEATLDPFAARAPSYISFEEREGAFPLSTTRRSAPLCVSPEDHPGVVRIARLLQEDLRRVTDAEPDLLQDSVPCAKAAVLIGTLGRSPLLDRLGKAGTFDAVGLAGKREAFVLQTVRHPLPGLESALVIAGSDKRGTLYGMLDLSLRIGVSPWYWWADVPVPKRRGLFVLPGRHTLGEPAVVYRGIFINDESPSLDKWAHETFGGFNHAFYEKVFELILRLKGNLLWPAMWGRAFYDDDRLNPESADLFGIVIGTSHHEPMMRAHQEWSRYGTGSWNYQANEQVLREFWEAGIRSMGQKETIVTLGMRGDGDMPMTTETNLELLQRIIRDQRGILARLTGKDPAEIPQQWALYKEVQEYYDQGMQVPDDVTLLFSDDNWGNIRRLPEPGAPPRSGGYGVYYHFDYVGDPRNYKWLNTSPIARTWEQMHLAYRHGVRRIWIVNVGDIKPMEFPASFFLDYAWKPETWPAERLPEYTRLWAEQQFGPGHAEAVARILAQYTQFNSRRKPELLSPETYSQVNYREAETVAGEYHRLAEEAERLQNALPEEYRDAYHQLVLHPVKACANLNALYVAAGRNRLYAGQGRAATNDLAEEVRRLFARDAEYSRYYNETMAAGKWNHMMDQTHIGYTTWQQPKENVMPELREIELPDAADMGVAMEGSGAWWPHAAAEAVLPEFDCYRRPARILEVFNRGRRPFDFEVRTEQPWLSVSPARGTVEKERRLEVRVDWDRAPRGASRAALTVIGPRGARVVVQAPVHNPSAPKAEQVCGFVEGGGCVSMEAEHYSRAVETASVRWLRIPDFGRTLSGMTPMPVTAPSQTPGGETPRLEYRMHLFRGGKVRVLAYLAPTLDFRNAQGLRYGVSFDDEPPRTVRFLVTNPHPDWMKAVSDNIILADSEHDLGAPGEHVLKFWMVDPGVVLEKLVVDTGGVKPSYLGPPESYRRLDPA